MNKGDTVRMSEAGRRTYADKPMNPHEEIGRVEGLLAGGKYFTVQWAAGRNSEVEPTISEPES